MNKKIKIYLIAGKAQSGKDTVAKYIKKICNEYNLKHINLQYSFYFKNYAKNIISWDGKEETKPREFLQFLGTDLIRKEIDELFFVNRMIEDIKVYSYFFDIITVSDVRFKIEIDLLKKIFKNTYSIQIVRPNMNVFLTEKQKKHRTEIDLVNYKKYDYIITNDKTLIDLEKKVRKTITKDLIK